MAKGWRNESKRHSLASKGIKTAQKVPCMRNIKQRCPDCGEWLYQDDTHYVCEKKDNFREGMLVHDGKQEGLITKVGENTVQVYWQTNKWGKPVKYPKLETVPKGFVSVGGG